MKDDFKEFVDNYKKDPEKSKQQKQAKLNRNKNINRQFIKLNTRPNISKLEFI